MTTKFPIESLRSVELEVQNLDQATAFYTDVWGLSDAGRSDGFVYLRCNSDDPYVVRLSQGSKSAILSYTLRAAAGTDLTQLRARALAAGGLADGGITQLSDLGGGRGFALFDFVGRRLRIVQDDNRIAPQKPLANSPDRLAHININTTNLERDIAFYVDGLGFKVADRSRMMGFVRTNADHHSIVLAKADVDTLNHIAFNHPTWENVMKASGGMVDAHYSIGWGPGRHGPGDNVFMYFVDPSGFVLEHTAEVLQIDDSYRVGAPADWGWPAGRTDQWGIAPPKTEICKAAQLSIAFK